MSILTKLRVSDYVRAFQPCIWLKTDEYDDAISNTIAELNHHFSKPIQNNSPVVKERTVIDPHFTFLRWDVADGLKTLSPTNNYNFTVESSPAKAEERTPAYPLVQLRTLKAQTILFLFDYHEFIGAVTIWRQIQNLQKHLAKKHITIIVISPVVKIPNEIADYFVVIDYNYPDVNWIRHEVDRQSKQMEAPIDNVDAVVHYAQGLTRAEIRRALLTSVCNTNPKMILASYMAVTKEARIEKEPYLRILPSKVGFQSIIGMEKLKGFARPMAISGAGRGILLLGVPGTGKSAFAGTLGYETGRVTIALDFGTLMGGIVGDTERNTDRALKFIDAMSPCILFIDEIEKGLAGTSGYSGDSGTSRRQGSLFLKWLSDHNTDVFVIATANSVADLPPEYKRAERWDAIFFVDIPDLLQACAILDYYKQYYGLPPATWSEQALIANLTGAEIKSICRIARTLSLPLSQSRDYIKPIAESMDIEGLRSLANTCAVPTD